MEVNTEGTWWVVEVQVIEVVGEVEVEVEVM